MAGMITCECGASFEVDETLAGQEILCPDCQRSLQASSEDRSPRITSAWALVSVVLALVGAFTVFGSLLAVLLGIIALLSIARHRREVAGAGFAVFGICLGAVFTALTLFALNRADVLGVEAWLRSRDLAQQVDTSGPLEEVRNAEGFAITRPTEKWGRLADNRSGDPVVTSVQNNLDLLLMQPARHAFIDVRTRFAGRFFSLDQCQNEILAEFAIHRARLSESRRLRRKDGVDVREMELEARFARQPWYFRIRMYRRGDGPIYVVRAYVPQRRLNLIAAELRTALDSFRLLPG